jgi:hypothetical protein
MTGPFLDLFNRNLEAWSVSPLRRILGTQHRTKFNHRPSIDRFSLISIWADLIIGIIRLPTLIRKHYSPKIGAGN